MKLIRSMSTQGVSLAITEDGLVKKESSGSVYDAAASENPGEDAAAPSKTSASVAPSDAAGASSPSSFQPILNYQADKHDKVGNYMKDMRNPSLSVSEKAKRTFNFLFFFGIDREIADFGLDEHTVANIHDVAIKYYGKTESVFRFLQFLTSSLACLAHGANDVGLSVGPIAILYGYWSDKQKWQSSKIVSSFPVLDWMLAIAAICLCLGFWFYG